MTVVPSEYTRPVYTDISLLWSLDPIVDPELADCRGIECFAYLCDAVCDPRRTVRCVSPGVERFEDERAPLPQFYHALRKAGLLDDQKLIAPNRHALRGGQLSSQIGRFAGQCELQPDLNREWLALHLHAKVQGGWQYGVPDLSSDPDFQYIPQLIVEFIESTDGQALDRICRSTLWTEYEAALAFSLVSRGWSYWQGVEEAAGEYLTHPTRWQVQLDHHMTHEPPRLGFGFAVGGVVLGAIREGKVRPDASAVADRLARVRDNASGLWKMSGEEAFSPRTDKQRNEVVDHLLAGVVWRPFSVPIGAGVRLTLRVLAAAGAVEAAGRGADPVAAASGLVLCEGLIDRVKIGGLPASATALPMVRRVLSYSSELEMPVETCRYCGSRMLAGTCRLDGCDGRGVRPQSSAKLNRRTPAGNCE